MNGGWKALGLGFAAAVVCASLSCGAPPQTAPYFRRGVLELGRLAGGKLELREFRGKWLEPTLVDLGSAEEAEGALGFASGLMALRRGRDLSFHAPTGLGWAALEERAFRLPGGCRAVLDFEADALALAFDRDLRVYRFEEPAGWREDPSLRLALPRKWEAVFNLGFTSIGVVAGGKAVLMQRRGGGWEEAPYGSFPMPPDWRSVFGFQANGAGVVLDGKVVFMQYLDGGWREVPEAVLDLR